jgi:outer membrane protein TolC
MEAYAVLHRPEVIEAGYNERIGLEETHKAMAQLLPGISVKLGASYDSNSYLLNNNWQFAGVQVSWNLFNLLNAKQIKGTAEAQYQLAVQQKLALNMAVLTQTHVAYLEYQGRRRQFELNRDLNDVEQRILTYTRNTTEANADGKLAEIRAATAALTAELRLYQSYSALQGAYGQLIASLGLDPVPVGITQNLNQVNIASLRAMIAQGGKPVVKVAAASK